ncbi:MAG: TetR/AcrR family transcriptional regulator, partial [Acidimicrobiia bacterium]|nr:TetR/AcrR family transcriptional regulator [Acidimicrobiia bacterium]
MSTESPYGDPSTRARILDATWELVAEQGAGLKLSEVASRASVSRQAIYLHFGDRPGLLVAL